MISEIERITNKSRDIRISKTLNLLRKLLQKVYFYFLFFAELENVQNRFSSNTKNNSLVIKILLKKKKLFEVIHFFLNINYLAAENHS